MEFRVEFLFPIITTIVSFLFFLSVSEQYYRKRKPHQLVWAISMFLFFITAGSEGFSLFYGSWIPEIYRFYYWFAAVQVSLMGSGLIYLFTNRNVINSHNSGKAVILFFGIWTLFSALFIARDIIFMTILIPSSIILALGILYQITMIFNSENWFGLKWQRVFTGHNFAHLFLIMSLYLFLLMGLAVFSAEINLTLLQTGEEVSGCGWETSIYTIESCDAVQDRATTRFYSPLHTIPGGIALIGGGFYSYYSWQKGIKFSSGSFNFGKGLYNIYIAVGALILGFGATLGGIGLGTLYISEVFSVILMYYGFLESDKITKDKLFSALSISWVWKKTSAYQS